MTLTTLAENSAPPRSTYQKDLQQFSRQLLHDGFFHQAQALPHIEQDYSDEEIEEFKNSWNHLLPDQYLNADEKYRSRRICKLHAYHGGHEIVHVEDCSFFQDDQTNKKLGGIERVYARSEGHFLYSRLLEGIILADLQILNHALGPRNWLVTCHQFRIHCDLTEVGLATPEGIHSDGHDYVAQHFINRLGIDGGDSRIYDKQQQLLKTRILQNFLETLMLNDRRVLHDVAPITRKTGHVGKTLRDMLVVDFDAII